MNCNKYIELDTIIEGGWGVWNPNCYSIWKWLQGQQCSTAIWLYVKNTDGTTTLGSYFSAKHHFSRCSPMLHRALYSATVCFSWWVPSHCKYSLPILAPSLNHLRWKLCSAVMPSVTIVGTLFSANDSESEVVALYNLTHITLAALINPLQKLVSSIWYWLWLYNIGGPLNAHWSTHPVSYVGQTSKAETLPVWVSNISLPFYCWQFVSLLSLLLIFQALKPWRLNRKTLDITYTAKSATW